MKTEVLIFASRDDRNSGYDRAKELETELKSLSPASPVRFVHKLGFVEEDLLLVARYRVVSTPSIVIVKDGKPVFRQTTLPTAPTVQQVLASM